MDPVSPSQFDKNFSKQETLTNPEFLSVLERMNMNERAAFIKELDSLNEKKTSEVADHIKMANYDSIQTTPDFDFLTLNALKKGLITKSQFTTAILMFGANKVERIEKNFKRIPLFVDHAINPEAKKEIKRTFEGTSEELTEDQLNAFFEEMRKIPEESEKFFSMAKEWKPTTMEEIKKKLATANDLMSTLLSSKFTCLLYNKGDNARYFMIPSFSMLQTFLNVSSENPMILNPVIGLSELEKFFEAKFKENKQDFGLFCCGKEVPKMIDRNRCYDPYSAAFHDFYHAVTGSKNKYRMLFFNIADRIKNQNSGYNNILFNLLVDLDFPNRSNPEFWMSFLAVISFAYQEKLEQEGMKPDDTSESAKKIFEDFLESEEFKNLVNLVKFFAKEYKIDLQRYKEIMQKDHPVTKKLDELLVVD